MKTETQGSETMETETETFKRGLVTGLAMLGVGLTAAVTSWVGWTGLAELCGFNGTWTPGPGLPTLHVSWLVAVSVDLYAMVGFRVWLHGAPWVSDHTRNFARYSTFAAILLGSAANVAYHLIAGVGALGQVKAPMLVTVAVSSLAPVFLGLVAHMDALLRKDQTKARAGETPGAGTQKSQSHASRVMGLAWSRLEKALETKETGTPETAKVETQTPAPETGVSVPMKTETVETETVGTGSPAPVATGTQASPVPRSREAEVSSLPARSQSRAEQLQMIKDAVPQWRQLGGEVPNAELIKATGIKGKQSLTNLRKLLRAEAALPADSTEEPTEAPDDARELMGVS